MGRGGGRSRFIPRVLAACVFAGTACGPGEDIVTTSSGAVRGVEDGATLAFRGIPYARPPVGSLRWREPEPPVPWSGVRDATAPASSCVQGNAYALWGSEDCLYLNVFAPIGTPPDARLPTLVHLHGGGNVAGEGHDDASLLVARDVVVVTLNYRLGVFGFLAHRALTAEAGHSSNYGLLDQIAALRWVSDNIAAFGGDPDNVTLFGLSAGSKDAAALAASPLTDGLVHRAALQGLFPSTDSLAWAETHGAVVARGAGCEDVADVAGCLRRAPVELLFDVLPWWFDGIDPVRDGYVLPDRPGVLLPQRGLDLLIGSDREEYAGDWVGVVPADLGEADYVALLSSDDGYGPLAPDVLAVYPASDYDSPFWALVTVDTDFGVTCSTRRVALDVAGGEPRVWRYLFTHGLDHAGTHGEPFPDFRASHGTEEAFLWDGFDDNGYEPTEGERALSGQMADYWTNFARTGDPNGPGLPEWPRYDADREPILLLDTPPSASEAYHVPQCGVQERALDQLLYSQPDEPGPPPPPDDPDAPYTLETCRDDECLNRCRPYPKPVVASDDGVRPQADLYCESNEAFADEDCGACTRSINVRVERRPADGPIDLTGDAGSGEAVRFDEAGTWSADGPAMALTTGTCYRTASRVELAFGFAAGSWTYGEFSCF